MSEIPPSPSMPSPDAPGPGAELGSAIPLFGLALMALNDHVLRPRWPGWVTGKLSDLAVVLFFPFLVSATLAWLAWGTNTVLARVAPGRAPLSTGLTPARLWIGLLATASSLAAINLSVPARDLYVALLETVDLFGWIGPFRYTLDPTDCLGLLGLPVAWWWGRRLVDRAAPSSSLKTPP